MEKLLRFINIKIYNGQITIDNVGKERRKNNRVKPPHQELL